MEPKQKQHPVVDVIGGGGGVDVIGGGPML